MVEEEQTSALLIDEIVVGKQDSGRLSKAEKKVIRSAKRKERAKLKRKENKRRRKENHKLTRLIDPTVAAFRSARPNLSFHLEQCMLQGLNICIDLEFGSFDQQNPKEISSLCKQIVLSYAYIKRSMALIHLHLTSLTTHSPIYSNLIGQGMEGWVIDRHQENVFEVFPLDRLVYLSPDADEVLDSIDTGKIYIIGGIVDRTVKKAWTRSKADDRGICCRRLPIQEYIPSRLSHVLNIDHVVQIMGEYLIKNNWSEPLMTVVPKRKQGNTLKEQCTIVTSTG